jgi:hypothetical protein
VGPSRVRPLDPAGLTRMSLTDTAAELLARLARDLARTGGGVLVVDGVATAGSGGPHPGSWGVALSFAEMARVDGGPPDWEGIARDLTEADNLRSGRRGALRGPERSGVAGVAGVAGATVAALDEWLATRDPIASQLVATSARAALAAEDRLDEDGLCEGLIGVLVVAAGAARILGDADLAAEVSHRAGAAATRAKREGWRLGSRQVDQTWLTGVAGIAWGLLAVDQCPRVNPLCPADAEASAG